MDRLAVTGCFALADALWISALRGRPDRSLAESLLERQLPGGGWAGDAHVLVPAQNADRPPTTTQDARGIFTTATVLNAAIALLRAAATVDLPSGSGAAPIPPGVQVRGTDPVAVPDTPSDAFGLPEPRAAADPSPPDRDERWDGVIARAAHANGIAPERALTVFRALTRESLAAGSPWPSAQLSSLASGAPVELSAGAAPGLRLTCEVGDPRLSPPDRVRYGLRAVERTAQLLGMGEAWSGRRGELVRALADPALSVPEGCRFWLWAGVDLPAQGDPVLKAYLSLHAGDVDDWRSRLHAALHFLPSAGTVWPALACLRGAGWCHEVGVGELPGDRWGLKVYYELDRWRPDLVSELLRTCALPASVADLTPDIPGVIRAAHRDRRRTGIALRVDPATGDVVEVTTTVALPPPMVGRDVIADRVGAWLASRGQDPAALTATIAAVEPEWVEAPTFERMLGLVTLSAGRPAPAATVYVRPRPTTASG